METQFDCFKARSTERTWESCRCMALLRKQLSSAFKSSRTTNIHYAKQRSLPPGTITEFVWKDYSSSIFRNIQELGNISSDEYMLAVCRHETLMELALRGGCCRPFYLPNDGRFVVKTLRKAEAKVLMDILPRYYKHIKKHQNCLLAKYYGLHAARAGFGGQKVYFVVMENLLQTELHLHRRYDLKGSSQGRSPSKVGSQPRHTLKDPDFDLCFFLEASTRSQVLEQIKLDCEFLEEQGIMDYSLLLGMHVQSIQRDPSLEKMFQQALISEPVEEDESTQPQILESHHRRDPTLSDYCSPYCSPSNSLYSPEPRFGAKLQARAVKVPLTTSASRRGAGADQGSNVYIYLGIIDFLQNYNVVKRIEHAYKSLHFNAREIPSVNPKLYSARFQEFLCKVFLVEQCSPPSKECLAHNTSFS